MPGCANDLPVPPLPSIYGGNLDQATLQAFQALGRVLHLQRQAMRRLSNPHMHHGEIMTLRLLATTDGISQRDLADTLHLSRPRITGILQDLEKSGAVRREADAADQRVTRVFLTEEGRLRDAENRAGFERYLNATIGKLSDDDKRELAQLLDQLSGHISELVNPGSGAEEVKVES